LSFRVTCLRLQVLQGLPPSLMDVLHVVPMCVACLRGGLLGTVGMDDVLPLVGGEVSAPYECVTCSTAMILIGYQVSQVSV
jgi:hypothetical protein